MGLGVKFQCSSAIFVECDISKNGRWGARSSEMGFLDCEICAALWAEACSAIRAQLEAISAVEDAVAQKQAQSIADLEDSLAAARDNSARAMHEYRGHRAQAHRRKSDHDGGGGVVR